MTYPLLPETARENVQSQCFGMLADGTQVDVLTLRNRRGMEARVLTYGGVVALLTAPDRAGHYADVVLGANSLDEYVKNDAYFGAIIGRYANRIARGRFALNGTTYALAVNDGSNALHGGLLGFDKVIWRVAGATLTAEGPQITLVYRSPDGEEGYPGNLDVTAIYTLTEDDALRIQYVATTDRVTVVNLTNHSYFNLRGHGDVLGHVVQIDADRFTPVDATLLPTGKLRSVADTPFDFRKPTTIGHRIDSPDPQLIIGNGYDHNWVVRDHSGELTRQATICERESGRILEVSSTEPGLQFYTGNFLGRSGAGKSGRYSFRSGFTLEPQKFPDSPNYPDFPSSVLRPGDTYRHTIVYRFRAE
ncbi:MAG: galactose mutarotase [Pseudomonadota bacterium]|nr:galactose mutarotase [Pseudomonadota bacterium]